MNGRVSHLAEWVASWWPKYADTVQTCVACKSDYDKSYMVGAVCKGCSEDPL